MQLYLVFGRGVLRAAAGRRRISHARLHAGTDFGAIARVAAAGSAGLVAVGGAARDAGRAERVVAESVLEGLVGGRLLAASSLAFFGGGLLGGDLFSRGLFGGRLLGSSLFGGGLLGGVFLGLLLGGDLFGCGLFRSGLVGGSLVSGLAFLFQALLSFSSACLRSSSRRAFSLAASAASRAFSSSSRFFLACCSAISGSTSDLGGWTLGSGGGGEDPAASAARVPVAAWAEAGVWAVRAWAAAKRANCRSPRAALPPGRAFPCASSG